GAAERLVGEQQRLVRLAGVLVDAERPVEEHGCAQLPKLARVAQVRDALAQQFPAALAGVVRQRVAVVEPLGPPRRLEDLLGRDADERRRQDASVLALRGRQIRHGVALVPAPQQPALAQGPSAEALYLLKLFRVVRAWGQQFRAPLDEGEVRL